MSHLKFGVYPGFGEYVHEALGYNQAVRVGDRIEISGQGGWDASEPPFVTKLASGELSIEEEIAIAFKNVETALKTVGGKGWSQVYRVNSYHTEITPEATAAMTANFKKWMPDHKPIWTQTGTTMLGAPGMRVEIEVVAHDPEGATKA